MFADTYRKVQLHAEQEYAFKKYRATHVYLHVFVCVPPPFNMAWVLWELRPGHTKRMKAWMGQRRAKYKAQAPMHAEAEYLHESMALMRERVAAS